MISLFSMFFSVLFKIFLFANVVKDARCYKISLPCVFAMAVIGAVLRGQRGSSFLLVGINSSFIFIIVFMLICFVSKGLGFGDVLFIGALSIFFGPALVVVGCLIASLSGMLYIIFEKIFLDADVERIPFCPFLAVGIFSSELARRFGWI